MQGQEQILVAPGTQFRIRGHSAHMSWRVFSACEGVAFIHTSTSTNTPYDDQVKKIEAYLSELAEISSSAVSQKPYAYIKAVSTAPDLDLRQWFPHPYPFVTHISRRLWQGLQLCYENPS
jgi:hypothetical protein